MTRLALIGTGLMGGSLGLALRRAKAVDYIVGCSRNTATLEVAQAHGCIDEGFTSPADAVRDADIVVITSPLSSYSTIAKAIAPALKPDAIVTDAGSVKYGPTQDVLAHFNERQKALFVPGHPIAGTEKSGPEAAFANLYEGKRVILTPLEFTSGDAVVSVAELWQRTGAYIDMLEIKHHDVMYAEISHNIQLMSFVYGALLSTQPEALRAIQQDDVVMQASTRLSGSNYWMWHDIFYANAENMLQTHETSVARLQSLLIALRTHGYEAIHPRIEQAAENRKRIFSKFLFNELQLITPLPPCTYALLMCIATAAMEAVVEENYAYAVGSGFRDMVASLVLSYHGHSIFKNVDAVCSVLEDYIAQLRKTAQAVSARDDATIKHIVEQSNTAYAAIR